MAGSRPQALRTRVPFFDLRPAHDGLKARILGQISDLIDDGAFINGAPVADFERAFARYCESAHCVGVGSGLDALRLGLIAAGVESGDEGVVAAENLAATIEAGLQAGAAPVLADASEADYNLDPDAAEAAITSRTRYLLPVHL